MIKAKITTAHGEGLVIALSRQNCERLLAGEPILFDTAVLELPPMLVLIAAGETEEALMKDVLSDHIGPDTRINPETGN